MTLRPAYALGHSEFNDFLFASVGVQENGVELTVLSALARLDLDPWGEAARLSGLSKEDAADALAARIHALPDREWKTPDARPIAIRLVALLPRHVASRVKAGTGENSGKEKLMPDGQKWLLWIGLAVAAATILRRLFGD
ncbi:MAG: hypothetical protein ACPGRZ_14510 [Alphaproteobacteria bacterium]